MVWLSCENRLLKSQLFTSSVKLIQDGFLKSLFSLRVFSAHKRALQFMSKNGLHRTKILKKNLNRK